VAETELLLLRHAESTWNARRLWQGQGDPPLSDTGRARAGECADRVRALAPHLAVVSDLRRARETAEIVTRGLAIELRIDVRWREWDVGEWSGRSRAEIRERWPELYRAFREGDPDVTPPGGEPRRTLGERVRAAARELLASHPQRRILVVTHRGVIHALLPETAPEHLQVHSLLGSILGH
jgi:probable phosphoglycerate mutase